MLPNCGHDAHPQPPEPYLEVVEATHNRDMAGTCNLIRTMFPQSRHTQCPPDLSHFFLGVPRLFCCLGQHEKALNLYPKL